jgi:primosomal protein N'
MKMRGMQMDVVLEGDGPEGVAVQHIKWTVDARPDERSYKAMAHALSHWINVDTEELKAFRDAAIGMGPWAQALPAAEAAQGDISGLNVQQAHAAKDIWSRSNLSLLHGPPGTGKTRTLVSAVAGLVQDGEKVLASAPSNMAVDVLVERLGAAGLDVVRVGHPIRVGQHVRERTLDANEKPTGT